MATFAITGSASGIGRATWERLEGDGHRVIGVDLKDAEVIADLSTLEGRAEMVGGVTAASGGVLDGLVAAAGIMGGDDAGRIVAVNYFGAVATLAGLRSLLAQGASRSAVALSSNSATTAPGIPTGLADACLAGDEAAACAAAGTDTMYAYAASKLALAHWVRHQAVGPDWAGRGIRLNAVAPGLIATPMTEDAMDFILGLGDVYPIPVQRVGRPEEVAGLLAYLLSPEANFFCGSFIVIDGGTDAALRAEDWPAPLR